MHSYNPAIHHVQGETKKGSLTAGGSIGINGVNVETGYSVSDRMAVFAGWNNSYQFSRGNHGKVRSYFDAGFIYIPKQDSTHQLFGLTAGGGIGSYHAKNNRFDKIEGEGVASYCISGDVKYHHFYLQPYLLFKDAEWLHIILSLKVSILLNDQYNIFGGRSFEDITDTVSICSDINFYESNRSVRRIVEPGLTIEFIDKNITIFLQGIMPVSFDHFRENLNGGGPGDYPFPTFQTGVKCYLSRRQ